MTTKEKERKTRKENISIHIINHTTIIFINTYAKIELRGLKKRTTKRRVLFNEN